MSRVLLVDDEQISLRVYGAVCDNAGIPYVTAQSGEEALAVMEAEPVHVLVTDLVMPGMNGIELFRQARQKRALIRAILISAYLNYETMLEVVEGGFDDCHLKNGPPGQPLIDAIELSRQRYTTWKHRIAELRGYKTVAS